MRFLMLLSALFICASAAFALGILSPVSSQIVEGTQITIGDVGPGQTFAVIVDPKVASGGKFGLGGAYDQLSASELPYGWVSSPSKLYSNPLQAEITVPQDAQNGEYNVQLSLWDEAGEQGLGQNISFSVKVQVTRDVMDMKVEPTSLSVGAGQPARYSITIVNKGIASDTFTVGSKGIAAWTFTKPIFIPSGTSRTLNYEVAGNDESDYALKLWARSSSSDQIYAERDATLRVNSDLFSDYKAVNKGVLLFPVTEAPIYFIVGLLSNLLP